MEKLRNPASLVKLVVSRLTRSIPAVFWRVGVLTASLALAVGGVAASAGWFAEDPQLALPPPAPAAPPPRGSVVGKAGCAATACHGGPAHSLTATPTDGCWQGSATHWEACDPHQRAYSLLTDKPVRPVRHSADSSRKGLGWRGLATEESRCLACHTTPSLATDRAPVEVRREGVSCEACHGNARSWQYAHTVRAEWPHPGMTRLNDLGVRAKTCAGCHVGAPAADGDPLRDMNHDMIAAGHPRLEFDFGEHHRRLPMHWLERDRSKTDAPKRKVSESHLWLVGRVAQAEAACELLASRAERASRNPNDTGSPWPEFAEFNCVACHHTIPVPDRDRKTDGRLTWQSLGSFSRSGDPRTAPLADLAERLGTKRPPRPDELVAPATQAAAQLKAWREQLAKAQEPVNRFLVVPAGRPANRDELAAVLSGLAALARDKGDGNTTAKVAEALRVFREWTPDAENPAEAEQAARRALDDLLALPR